MNIKQIALSISQSRNEKNFNACIKSIVNENIQGQKNICDDIFKIFDTEIEKDSPNHDLLRTLLSIPLELAAFHQNQKHLAPKNLRTEELIDFISSHFLARSNGSHESLRLAMMIFFSHIKNQPLWKKQRILERFGENILRSVFTIYSTDKAKSPVAFHFLSENLESFLSLSPDLAAMTNSFLQTYMFKQHTCFIVFMNQYKNYLSTKGESAEFFIVHLSFLIRQAVELEHEELSLNLIKIFVDYVYSFAAPKGQDFHILSKIMLQSKCMKAREIGLYFQNEIQNNRKISCKFLFKNLNLQSKEGAFVNTLANKKLKRTEDISLFQKIFLLCSNTF